jgi:hypothetical protein
MCGSFLLGSNASNLQNFQFEKYGSEIRVTAVGDPLLRFTAPVSSRIFGNWTETNQF